MYKCVEIICEEIEREWERETEKERSNGREDIWENGRNFLIFKCKSFFLWRFSFSAKESLSVLMWPQCIKSLGVLGYIMFLVRIPNIPIYLQTLFLVRIPNILTKINSIIPIPITFSPLGWKRYLCVASGGIYIRDNRQPMDVSRKFFVSSLNFEACFTTAPVHWSSYIYTIYLDKILKYLGR